MAKKYTGSLSLEWFNKQKSILVQTEETGRNNEDAPAPRINWINKDDALFYEIIGDEGIGLSPYWVDRNDLRVKEARPLIFQKAYKAVEKPQVESLIDKDYLLSESEEDDPAIENMLIRGDNLLALNALKKLFENRPDEERIKCIYIDPPYNTGAAFQNYDDNLEHSEWLSLFRDRVQLLKDLMQEGGLIFVQLDDSEGHYGKVVLDDVFGRHNHQITFYVKVRYDDKTLKEDMKFNKLIEMVHVYRKSDMAEVRRETTEYSFDKFVFSVTETNRNPQKIELGGKQVEVFRPGEYGISQTTPSKEGLKEVWASGGILDGNSSGRFFRDFLSGRQIEDGLGCLYKVQGIGDDGRGYRYFTGPKRQSAMRGKYYQGVPREKQSDEKQEKNVPISNYLDFAAAVGNCGHEGGVKLNSGKKPEALIKRFIELSSDEGDLVLDIFGGSGTTFAVAHKMKRRWIGVEIGQQAESIIIPRLNRVLSGKDRGGISEEVNWHGGGSFKFCTLGESIINREMRDFNWKLGREFIENSLLSSYDLAPDPKFSLPQIELIATSHKPAIGFHRVGQRRMAAVVSLGEPKDDKPISYDEWMMWYDALKKYEGTQSVTVFTNRGIELAYDSKPEDLEVIKVPHAIFAELEK